MKELSNVSKFYQFLEENCGDDFFKMPPKKTCTVGFESEKCKFSMDIDEDEMVQLIGACVKGFGLRAVINAIGESDE